MAVADIAVESVEWLARNLKRNQIDTLVSLASCHEPVGVYKSQFGAGVRLVSLCMQITT